MNESKLARLLREEGLVPAGCTAVNVETVEGSPVKISYTVSVGKEDLQKLTRVFARLGVEA
jgi:hypothetical protein